MKIEKKIYFASDFHLGMPDLERSLEREKSIVSWLNAIANDASAIYLLGDVFDFWFEYKTVVPKGFVRFLGAISRLTDAGIPVYLFPGNHDLWVGKYLEAECGVVVVKDAMTIELGNDICYLHHGDGLGPGDVGYKWLKKVFLSKIAQKAFAMIHPGIGVSFAQKLSKKSRLAQNPKEDNYLGDSKEYLTQFCKQYLLNCKTPKPKYFIFGHRHLVLDIDLGEGVRYINLGEWLHGSQYAEYDGVELRLKAWVS
ncbi:MAG: UDP-2,3-diacylglucosamine diphosphatase [Bacteroidetes bacterium]|nr:UDP-2,3-diacylglucosamine diphosphatase [Bacteroidota bacterium]